MWLYKKIIIIDEIVIIKLKENKIIVLTFKKIII